MNEDINNYPDDVIQAVVATDNYEIAYLWLDAIAAGASDLNLEIDQEISQLIDYLDNAIHAHDRHIHQKMWETQPPYKKYGYE